MTIILDNYAVQELLTMSDCIDVLEKSQNELGHDRAVMGPVHRVLSPIEPSKISRTLPEGSRPFYSFSSMAAVIPEWDVAAVRQDSDLINYFETEDGLRSARIPAAPGNRFCGFVLLHRASTGELLAVIHDGFLQKTRVGGLAGVAARHLAREDSTVLAVLGSGWQASAQVEAHCLVRDIRTIRVFSPNPERRHAFAARMASQVGISVEPAGSGREAVRDADIVATATNSLNPVVQGNWLEPGMFLTNVKEVEFHDDVYERCDVLTANRRGPIWNRYVMGGVEAIAEHGQEIWYRWTEQQWEQVRLLGEIVAGRIPGRTSLSQTIAFMNQGEGLQFAAVGSFLYDEARRRGVGTQVSNELFHQGEEFIP